jgi:hypothetical protein
MQASFPSSLPEALAGNLIDLMNLKMGMPYVITPCP